MQDSQKILGETKTVRKLLTSVKYSIDYYQREYKWQEKQVRELIDDLSNKFFEDYSQDHTRGEVRHYPHYFLGSIIISERNGVPYIVDGQQRLTSLTLILILLRNLQRKRLDIVNVDELIFSELYGEKSFNLHVDERAVAMKSLYENQPIDTVDCSESVQNLVKRYRDLESFFPIEPNEHALPYFIDWLLNNVHLVEITAYSDADAYTIFETMNDRGLSLSSIEMLKGYLLANIREEAKRTEANHLWRSRIRELDDAGKVVDADFFKAWFRSQYANKIRSRKKGAKPEDFDRIGTEFHRWIRDTAADLALTQSDDFFRFIICNFRFYSRQYLRIITATKKLVDGLEHVHYVARYGFTLQYMLLLAPLTPDDTKYLVLKKLELVAHYLDILLTWRLWNFRRITHSNMLYSMFLAMRKIRGLSLDELVRTLRRLLAEETETFTSNDRLKMHQQNRNPLHCILARVTDYVQTQSNRPSRYLEYMSEGKTRYEIEHIWANHWERHNEEFENQADFDEYRNRIGGLLLLPKSSNASFGDLPYTEKLPLYYRENLLACSLHPDCDKNNPGFRRFRDQSSLPFVPFEVFGSAALDQRSELYRQIAQRIWNPEDLLIGDTK